MLVVDDDLDALVMLGEVLRAEGIAVVGQATTGEAAVQLARELRPEVVLLDIRLPGMDGFETARRLHTEDPILQVVFLTAYEELLPGAAPDLGGYAYLVKGCSAGLMCEVIVRASWWARERAATR